MQGTIYDFIIKEKSAYAKPITLEDGWEWSMKEHLRKSFLYKNSQFSKANEDRELRPNKNIVLAIRNLQNRTEGFDVKDVEIYITNPEHYYKSFLVKKYHEKWVLENSIDTFIDDVVDSYGDYGGVLVRNTNNNRPEVVDLRSLAFANQRNILKYPFGIEHIMSFSELREAAESLGWGEESNGATIDIETFISLIKKEGKENAIIYEVHGRLPVDWLGEVSKVGDWWKKKDVNQIQIVSFYKKENGDEQGVTLFRKRMPKLPFKFLSRDKIYGRALGRGGIEELFEPQIWTNWTEIKVMEMLEAASKVIQVTDDPSLKAKHPQGLKNLSNLEIIEISEGKRLQQLDNMPRNLTVFNDALNRWEEHAQKLGAASEGMMGGDTPSGMPFKLFEAKTIEDKSLHKYRQGQIAVFVEEIYRDWILPKLKSEITNEQVFLAELSMEETQKVMEAVVENAINRHIKEMILNGQLINQEEIEEMRSRNREVFLKGGTKRFFKILKDEMREEEFNIMTNIAGKQKNLALLTDKLVNLVRQFLATPQLREDPEMVKLLNTILESSGLSPIMFSPTPAMPINQMPTPESNNINKPLADLSQANLEQEKRYAQ